MNIMVIWSSPNEQGLTAAAKDNFLNGLKQKCGNTTVVQLNRMKIKNCLACGNSWGKCQQQGSCIIKDDFQKLYDDMAEGWKYISW